MPDKNIYPNVQFPDFGALLESVKENGRITRIYQEGESKKGTDEHAAAARANSVRTRVSASGMTTPLPEKAFF